MAAPRRERDDRRSVGSHEKMMGALGRAAGWTKYTNSGYDFAVRADSKGEPAQEQIVGESQHAAFVPGKSNAVKFRTDDLVKTAYNSIVRKS